jgi:hypothetical protein
MSLLFPMVGLAETPTSPGWGDVRDARTAAWAAVEACAGHPARHDEVADARGTAERRGWTAWDQGRRR